MPAAKKKDPEIHVIKVDRGSVSFCVLGRSPIILNRMSKKGARELLFPEKKTKATREQRLKHDPLAEFRESPYTTSKPEADTLIEHLASAFKGGMRGAALDLPGTTKSSIGRLTWVEGDRVSIFGIPQLFMSITRSADINKTPDVRTRAIIPEWACRVTISFQKPVLNVTSVTNLLAAAGMTQGVGDWRNEKGSGSYGAFDLVSEKDETFQRILKTGGRAAQIEAMAHPAFYDDETAELFSWFEEEVGNRGKEEMLMTPRNGQSKELYA